MLDRLRDKGPIGYADVPGLPPQQVTCYLPRGGEEKLDGRARRLLDAVRANLKDLTGGEVAGREAPGRARPAGAARKGRAVGPAGPEVRDGGGAAAGGGPGPAPRAPAR